MIIEKKEVIVNPVNDVIPFKECLKIDIKDIFKKRDDKKRFASNIDFVIGDCGSGKSVYACILAQKYIRKGYNVYSNIYIKGCRKFDITDFMRYDFEEGSVIIFDEGATYGLASRGESHKTSNTKEIIEFFTMYRHYSVERIVIISPSFQDIIPVVRSRVKRIKVVKNAFFVNTLLTPVNLVLSLLKRNPIRIGLIRQIGKKIDVVGGGDGGSEPREIYKWIPFFVRIYFIQNKAYPYFDSYSKKVLKTKKWDYYS